jgi:hypothetical protein
MEGSAQLGVINFRDGYEFDPETFASSGGLPGMLRRMMQEQSLQRQGIDIDSTPNDAAELGPNSYGSPQGRLLGSLLSVQAEQGRYQPVPEDTRSVQFALRGPNFRQLSRIPAAGMSPVTDSSHQSNNPTNLMPGAVGSRFPLSEGASSAGLGLLDTYDTITARRIAPSTVPVGWRARGTPIRTSPAGPVSAPPMPMPKIPDWWIAAAKIGQILFRGMYGNAGDGRGAHGRCIRASEGSVDDWENFFKFLGREENNTVGGESQNRACWSKTFQSENEKRQWCENQFGNR